MEHHRKVEAVRYRAHKDRQVERLAALAEGADPALFMTLDGEEVKWEDWRKLPKEITRGISGVDIIDGKDGRKIKLRFRDPVSAERELAALLGHHEPEEHKVTVESAEEARARLAETIARRAKAKGG